MKKLYLVKSRAARNYKCENCECDIARGADHFRHDPYPFDRFGGRNTPLVQEPRTHWCFECIAATGAEVDITTGRVRVPLVLVSSARTARLLQIRIVSAGQHFADILTKQPELIYSLSPNQFEELICDRLYDMGLEPRRVGDTFQKDGGIDVLFWPRARSNFPFLGAAQIKHHNRSTIKEGPASVRDLAGVLSTHKINVGMLITNTSFTPDAQWFAKESSPNIRLRDMTDLRRWLSGNYVDLAEWRELPKSIELCPGVVVEIHGGR